MAKISRQAGTTGHILTLFIQDATSGTGAGLTGLTPSTSGLACYSKRNRGTSSSAVTLATIATLGTYVSGGFREVDAANMPGIYEFHPPDAALASGAGSVALMLRGAANMVPCLVEIELTATNNQDAQAGGLTALPATGTLAVTPTLAATQAFNNTGQTANLPAAVVAYTSGQDPATLLLTTPANKLATDGTGRVLLQPTQAGVTIPNVTTVTTTTTATGLTNLPAAPNNWLTAAALASDAVTEIQAGLPTSSAIAAATVASMATAPVGSVANLTPLPLPTGTVASSPAPTSTAFKGNAASGSTINPAANAYAPTNKRVRFVLWTTGTNAGQTSSIASYAGSGAFTLDAAPTGSIAAGDGFVVI